MKRVVWALGLALACALAAPGAASAAEKETWIFAGSAPYYWPGDGARKPPKVDVHPDFDALLASNRQADIVAVRDSIEADPDLVSPVTLMVLAIRFYDVGLRDDAVFWFYVSKYRGVVMRDVAEWRTGPFGDGWVDAMGVLISQSDEYFNGYAFCDFPNQQRINAKAIDWVEAHPYGGFAMPALKDRLKPGDLDENVKASIADLRDYAAREAAQMQDPDALKQFAKRRKANDADKRFCWKS